MSNRERLTKPIDPRDLNWDEISGAAEGNVRVYGIDRETATRWAIEAVQRRATEPTRQERIKRMDPSARKALRNSGLL